MPACMDTGVAKVSQIWPVAAARSLPDDELNRLVVDVTAGLIGGSEVALRSVFDLIASPTPTVVWEPQSDTLEPHPRLAFLQHYWNKHRRGADLPLSSSIDAIDLAPVLGYVMLLEPVDGGDDFLYRVYGTHIARQAGMEMTGRRVRDVPIPLVAVYFLATYRAVMQSRRPMFAHHATHHDIQVAQWDRNILPFVDEAGTVNRLLVGNVPSFRPGRTAQLPKI